MKEPDAGKPPVRFDEGGGEILPYSTPTLLTLNISNMAVGVGRGVNLALSLSFDAHIPEM